jgi:phosphatidylinositol 3-kinase
MFSSATEPMLLEFRDIHGKTCKSIYKKTDDLRGDQLIMQMTSLMDYILRSVGVDLRLTVYNVVVFSRDDGLIEFVPSETLQDILEDHSQSLALYFKKVTDRIVSDIDVKTNDLGTPSTTVISRTLD